MGSTARWAIIVSLGILLGVGTWSSFRHSEPTGYELPPPGPRSLPPEERIVPPRPRRTFALPRLEAWVFAQTGRDLESSPQRASEYHGPESIELRSEYGFDGVNLAKIDRDRDGFWDELWRFRTGGRVERSVSAADDERYTEHFMWAADHWDRVERPSGPNPHPHPH